MPAEKRKEKRIVTLLISVFYLVCMLLYFFGVLDKMFMVNTELLGQPAVAVVVFLLSVLVGISSAVFIDRIIFSEKIKFWRWRIGLLFGIIGVFLSLGAIETKDGIAELVIATLVWFWLYLIVGLFMGWIVDFFAGLKMQRSGRVSNKH